MKNTIKPLDAFRVRNCHNDAENRAPELLEILISFRLPAGIVDREKGK